MFCAGGCDGRSLSARLAPGNFRHPFSVWTSLENATDRIEFVVERRGMFSSGMKRPLLQVASPNAYCNLIETDDLDWLVFWWRNHHSRRDLHVTKALFRKLGGKPIGGLVSIVAAAHK